MKKKTGVNQSRGAVTIEIVFDYYSIGWKAMKTRKEANNRPTSVTHAFVHILPWWIPYLVIIQKRPNSEFDRLYTCGIMHMTYTKVSICIEAIYIYHTSETAHNRTRG
jgi:hypothetical protein